MQVNAVCHWYTEIVQLNELIYSGLVDNVRLL